MERDKLLEILSESETIIKQTLGSDFINQANSFSEIGLNKMQIQILRAKKHPFFTQWNLFKDDLRKFNISDTNLINTSLLWGLRLADQFKKTKKIPNISRILKAIKNPCTYHSACFELETAAEYSGCNIQVTEETLHRTPDLLINHNGKFIAIECKALADQEKKQSIIATDIIESIQKFLKQQEISSLVHIKMYEEINTENKDNLLKQIYCLILDKNIRQKEISTPHASVKIDRISAPFADPIHFYDQDASMAEVTVERQILPNSKTLIRNIVGDLLPENWTDLR